MAVDGSHPNKRASHGVYNPTRLAAITLPALPAHFTCPPAPLALPALEEDLHPFHGRQSPGEVLVEGAILEGHHDEKLAIRRWPESRRGQHGRHVARTNSERVGRVLQRLALTEKGGRPFSLTPRTERSHGCAGRYRAQFGTIAARVTWPLSCSVKASLICSSGYLWETTRPQGYFLRVRCMSSRAPRRCSAS